MDDSGVSRCTHANYKIDCALCIGHVVENTWGRHTQPVLEERPASGRKFSSFELKTSYFGARKSQHVKLAVFNFEFLSSISMCSLLH